MAPTFDPQTSADGILDTGSGEPLLEAACVGRKLRLLLRREPVVKSADSLDRRAQQVEQRLTIPSAMQLSDIVERGEIAGQNVGLPIVDHLQPMLDGAQQP